jgi:hypothetical protein
VALVGLPGEVRHSVPFPPDVLSVMIGGALRTSRLPQLRHLRLKWCDFEFMNYPPGFSKLRSRLVDVLPCVVICLCCLGLWPHGQVSQSDLTLQRVALDSDRHADRIADWAAQLPLGEALREGIVGYAIV